MISRERQIEIEIEVKEMLKEYELATYPISISKVAKALGIDLIPYSSLAEKREEFGFHSIGGRIQHLQPRPHDCNNRIQ